MGQLTQTTTQVQTLLNDADASNVGNTSISDASDTKSTAVKKSGFYSLGASASNAPSSDRSVMISAVRNTAASGEIRYGQIVLTESSGMYWAVDDNGTLSSWSEAIGTATTQTLTNKTLTSPVLTTPQINDSAADHQYIFAAANLAADRTVSLPLLAGNDTFVFEAFTQTLTNKTLTSAVLNTGVSGTAVLDEDNMASDSATQLATQQSIKAYVDGQVSGVTASSTTTFTNKTISGSNNTLSNIAMSSTAFVAGTGLTLSTNTVNIDAAQTGITSLLATDIKIGEDDQTKVDFGTANEIHLYADNTKRVTIDSTGLTVNSGSLETATIDFTDGDNALTIADGGGITAAAGITSTAAANAFGASSVTGALSLKNGSTSAGFAEFFEDSGNGTNKVTLIGPASTADVTVTLPASADTLVGKATTDTLTNKTLTTPTITTPVVNAGLQLKNGSTSAGFLEFFEDSGNGTNKVTLIGPASTADITLTLPSSDGDDGQALTTNGSGVLSFASSGGAYTAWAIKTTNYTASASDQLVCNHASTAFTITLPAGSANDTVIIANAGAALVTVGRNGSQKINSVAADGTVPQGNSVQLVYVDDTIGWFEI